jgi:hypothetical protein
MGFWIMRPCSDVVQSWVENLSEIAHNVPGSRRGLKYKHSITEFKMFKSKLNCINKVNLSHPLSAEIY